jgi:hypothetical protein
VELDYYFVRFIGNLVDDFSGAAKDPTSKKQKINNLLSERGA